MNKDLKNNVHEQIAKNQKSVTGERCIINIDGFLHEYYHDDDLFIVDRMSKKMKAELGWFERISNHAPSVGDYYENLVNSAIQEVLPDDLKLGTGFVYDSGRREVSPQIDLIIYQNKVQPALYKRGNFVVVDSTTVISCVEVKKTLTKSILNQIVFRYINQNLGTSPMGLRGVQFLNVFSFYSKISLDKIAKYIKELLVSYFNSFESETLGSEKVHFILDHFVLPRLYFFDRTGYISFNCFSVDDSSINIQMSMNRSSLSGHSLGEFLVSVTSKDKNEQQIANKNFLTFPLVMPELNEVIYADLQLWKKFSMENLIKLFPNEISLLKNRKDKNSIPYAALISSSIEDLSCQKLSILERSKGFKWLTVEDSC